MSDTLCVTANFGGTLKVSLLKARYEAEDIPETVREFWNLIGENTEYSDYKDADELYDELKKYTDPSEFSISLQITWSGLEDIIHFCQAHKFQCRLSFGSDYEGNAQLYTVDKEGVQHTFTLQDSSSDEVLVPLSEIKTKTQDELIAEYTVPELPPFEFCAT